MGAEVLGVIMKRQQVWELRYWRFAIMEIQQAYERQQVRELRYWRLWRDSGCGS